VAGACSFERIVVNVPPVTDIDSYKAIAEAAARAGATHITVSEVHAKSRWEIEDPTDPYAQWGIQNAAMFKMAVPEALRDFVPADYAEKALETVRRKGEIAAAAGLGRAYMGKEPYRLPEGVFQRHPEWRGARVDHPRRTRHAEFAPCVDHSEVLEMYRWAARKITEAAGGMDVFMMISNDSGAGLCWAEKLYNNPNGPASCRHRHVGERVGDLLAAIAAGAADAGSEAALFFRAKGTANEFALLARTLPQKVSPAGWPAGAGGGPMSPAIGISQPIAVLESLERANRSGAHTLSVASAALDEANSGVSLMRRFLDNPTRGPVSRMALLGEVAREEYGADLAEDVIQLWEDIRKGAATVSQMTLGGSMFLLCAVAQRWLTRPLVPFPAELPSQDRDYYRRFQFQANTEAEADDILNSQAVRMVNGRNQAYFVANAFDGAAAGFCAASDRALSLAEKAPAPGAEKLRILSPRLRALACLARTCSNMVQFQTLLDDARAEVGEEGPVEKPWILDGYGDRQKMYDVVRAEVDNAQDLIDVIESSPVPVIDTADDPAEEDTFALGPDLVDQIRHKIRTTMEHWLDFDRLYPRPNR